MVLRSATIRIYFMARWREIDALVDQPGPFIYVISRTGQLRKVNLG
jgi:hypothetical protein